MQKIFLLFLIPAFVLFPQKKDPELIIRKLLEKFNSVQDYQVDVRIKVDVQFITAPEARAKIYFKQPDKIHIESETFALIPKDGLNFSPSGLLQSKYTSIYEKEDSIDGNKVSVVKIIPLGQGNVILTTLFIDDDENIIRKLETTTKTEGTFSIDLKYKPGSKYPLPSEMIFSFDLERLNLPPGISGELSSESEEQLKKERNKPVKGKVYIAYSNYKVNQGIPDKIFTESSK
ncbi:MAG TPA: hypothetical protein VMT35_15090 [Ignavibacteriaceae bacterium]|nr:hypothetical protein [Ignavibacteriaceae bacterium]